MRKLSQRIGLAAAVLAPAVLSGVNEANQVQRANLSLGSSLVIADCLRDQRKNLRDQIAYKFATDAQRGDDTESAAITTILNQPLPSIINNDEAQGESVSCQSVRSACAAQANNVLECYDSESGPLGTATTMVSAKIHHHGIREAVVTLSACEQDLEDCVKKNVLPKGHYKDF